MDAEVTKQLKQLQERIEALEKTVEQLEVFRESVLSASRDMATEIKRIWPEKNYGPNG